MTEYALKTSLGPAAFQQLLDKALVALADLDDEKDADAAQAVWIEIRDFVAVPVVKAKVLKLAPAVAKAEVKALLDHKKSGVFNKLPVVQRVLEAIVNHKPRFAKYNSMIMKADPAATGLSLLKKQWNKANKYAVVNTPPRAKSPAEMPSALLTTTHRNNLVGDQDALKLYQNNALGLLCCEDLCCSGALSAPSNACTRWKLDAKNWEEQVEIKMVFDHLVAISIIGRVYDQVVVAVGKNKQLAMLVSPFIRHLIFATRPDPVFGWPANVYLRCNFCDGSSNKTHGTKTHDGVIAEKDLQEAMGKSFVPAPAAAVAEEEHKGERKDDGEEHDDDQSVDVKPTKGKKKGEGKGKGKGICSTSTGSAGSAGGRGSSSTGVQKSAVDDEEGGYYDESGAFVL